MNKKLDEKSNNEELFDLVKDVTANMPSISKEMGQKIQQELANVKKEYDEYQKKSSH